MCEARSLMTEALQVANDVDQGAPPELHIGLEHIRDLLDGALERIDGAMDSGSGLAGASRAGLSRRVIRQRERLHFGN